MKDFPVVIGLYTPEEQRNEFNNQIREYKQQILCAAGRTFLECYHSPKGIVTAVEMEHTSRQKLKIIPYHNWIGTSIYTLLESWEKKMQAYRVLLR